MRDAFPSALADRYRLREELGRGGMAVVYAADDVRHERRVAVKVLSRALSAEAGEERFLREIRVTAQLTHPHIVPVFDSGAINGQLYFVMPLVVGETLRDRLRRVGRLPIGEAVRIACEVADALAYANSSGVIHRDVKPENILLANGHALLSDFGIARASAVASETLTGTGVFLGTALYISPECALAESPATAAADVYSLACVLFEMLAGAPPFTGPTMQSLLAARLTQDAPRVRTRRADVTVELDAVIASALARDPQARCPNCGTLSEALRSAVAGEATVHLPDVSLVVRPFDAAGSIPELVEFAEGLTDEVIGVLSKIRGLRVISRTSALRLKGTEKGAREIGHEYGVRYLATGSVRRAGAAVRVACEVVDTILDASVWSERIDGDFGDAFGLQDRVARAVAAALDVQLTPADEGRLQVRPIPDSRAADCARRAMDDIISFREDQLVRGEELVRQGLALVGDNAQLFAVRAMAEFQWVNAGFDSIHIAKRLEASLHWIDRALSLDPGNADAHFTRGWIEFSRGDILNGMREASLALELEPGHVLARSVRCVMNWMLGRRAALRDDLERLDAIDPFNMWGAFCRAAERSLDDDPAGRDEAIRRVRAIAPGPMVDLQIATILFADGSNDLAREFLQPWAQSSGDDLGTGGCRAAIAALAGDAAPADRFAAVLALSEQLRYDPQWTWNAVQMQSIGGNIEGAVQSLERAVQNGFWNVEALEGGDVTLRRLQPHHRFAALLATARRERAALETKLARGG